MFYFTAKKTTDPRALLYSSDTQEGADAGHAALLNDFPDAEVGDVFESDLAYQQAYPNVRAIISNLDGSEDLLWSDGMYTPKPV